MAVEGMMIDRAKTIFVVVAENPHSQKKFQLVFGKFKGEVFMEFDTLYMEKVLGNIFPPK